MKDTIQIIQVKREDLREIASFLNHCWKVAYHQIISDDYLNAISVEEKYIGLLEGYDQNVSEFLMMTDDNQLIGVVIFGKSFTESYENDGEISAIYLHEKYIGQGYGHCLLTKAEQILISKGYSHFVVNLLEENTQALQFYLSHGYEDVNDSTIELGDNNYPLTVLRKENPLITTKNPMKIKLI
jgi:ribosomal protein S18 acetylase RimI-like enzyme